MTNPTPTGRPQAKALVQLDPYNAYARLGVSPLASIEEIKRVASAKRRAAGGKRRTRVQQQFGDEEAEMAELQELEMLIGTPKGRAAYDRDHPQNELLTVQPAPHDRWLDSRHRAGLITAWLIEELGRDVLLPSPECSALWVPHGLPPELAAFLQDFAEDSTESASTESSLAPDGFPAVAYLQTVPAPKEGPFHG